MFPVSMACAYNDFKQKTTCLKLMNFLDNCITINNVIIIEFSVVTVCNTYINRIVLEYSFGMNRSKLRSIPFPITNPE